MPPMKLLRCTNSKSHTIYWITNTAVARRADADRAKPGDDIPTRYSEPHTPPPNALRSIDDTPPPKSSITINDAHRILLPRWALFFCSPKSVYVAWAYARPANRQMSAQTTGGITFHRPKAACDSIRPLPKQQGWRKGGQKPAAIGNCLGTLGSYPESTSCGKHLLAALCK